MTFGNLNKSSLLKWREQKPVWNGINGTGRKEIKRTSNFL